MYLEKNEKRKRQRKRERQRKRQIWITGYWCCLKSESMKKTTNEGVNILTRKTVDGWKSSIEEVSIMRDQLVSSAVDNDEYIQCL